MKFLVSDIESFRGRSEAAEFGFFLPFFSSEKEFEGRKSQLETTEMVFSRGEEWVREFPKGKRKKKKFTFLFFFFSLLCLLLVAVKEFLFASPGTRKMTRPDLLSRTLFLLMEKIKKVLKDFRFPEREDGDWTRFLLLTSHETLKKPRMSLKKKRKG